MFDDLHTSSTDTVKKLSQLGFQVNMEAGAGLGTYLEVFSFVHFLNLFHTHSYIKRWMRIPNIWVHTGGNICNTSSLKSLPFCVRTASGFTDDMYASYGAQITDTAGVWKSDVILKVRPPNLDEVALLQDRTLISFIQPNQNSQLVEMLREQKATVFGIDQLPRTLSRGQAFDVLSSQVCNHPTLSESFPLYFFLNLI